MIRSKKEEDNSGTATVQPHKINSPLIFALGLAVGIITGFVGAGGGFMILPVLVLLGGLSMKVAIGTDLLIIAAKSLIGFIGEAQVSDTIDYQFVGLITLLPLVGVVISTYLNKREKEAVAEIAAVFGWKEFLGHIIGGCCGTTPEYIRQLASAL